MTKSAVAALVLSAVLVGCGEATQTNRQPPATPQSSQTSEDDTNASGAPDVEAARATVDSFFAVKASAGDSFSTKIDRQTRYLTGRDVHPSARFEADLGDEPAGITEDDIEVTYSNERVDADSVLIDFDAVTTGTSYALVGGVPESSGSPVETRWTGTATLIDVDGTWLIDAFDTDYIGGSAP